MIVHIDHQAGFCFGVINAIRKAEQFLEFNDTLYCLGDIVHNETEVKRLKEKGLIIIDYEEFYKLKDATVLIRAHGEPPSTYEKAEKNNLRLIDATCPIVLKLQKRIRSTDDEFQVVIFGKEDHPEVRGLSGQLKVKPLVISGKDQIDQIDFDKPVRIFSQTTMDKEDYLQLVSEIEKRAKGPVECNSSVCGQVSGRKEHLKEFASAHQMILFIGGRKSSNARVLFEICKETNPNTHFIHEIDDLKEVNTIRIKSVGITGATSTPMWQIKKVAEILQERTYPKESD